MSPIWQNPAGPGVCREGVQKTTNFQRTLNKGRLEELSLATEAFSARGNGPAATEAFSARGNGPAATEAPA